jgi:uncharacterized membrane protein YbaN (DUF454 family)
VKRGQDRSALQRFAYIAVGSVASLLAILGALLPGLPTTPFLLVALWAFARSSERMLALLERVPLLRVALVEARRFEERRTIRPGIKLTALACAWGSVLLTALAFGATRPMLLGAVVAAALGGTIAMWWFPSER